MKHIILFLTFAIFSGSAAAQWTLLVSDTVRTQGVDAGRGMKTSVNKENISKDGDRATMWTLTDYESPVLVGGKKHFSSKSLDEYDCQNEQYRTLALYWYSRHKGEGDLVYSDLHPSSMQPIIPNSIVQAAWKIACGKK